MRSIFVTASGIGSNERPWAQGVVDLTAEETLTYMRAGGKPPSGGRVRGIINGFDDEDVAEFKPGTVIAVDNATLSMSPDEYVKNGETIPSVNVSIRCSGFFDTEAAPTCKRRPKQ